MKTQSPLRPLLSFGSTALALTAALALLGCSDSSSEPGTGAATGDGTSTGTTTGDGTSTGTTTGDGTSTGTTTGDGTSTGTTTGVPSTASPDGLAGVYQDYFPMGVAIGPNHINSVLDIVTSEFNQLTAENDMKWQSLQKTEGTFSWQGADAIADIARENGMTMTGHTFVWHRQAPAWIFSDLTPGDAASIETLKARLKTHIEAVVERYGDVVTNWDVVNEAISDNGSQDFRDGPEGSKWFEIFESEEYVYWAFKYAHDALEAREPGSAQGKLYYNDYNMTLKVDRVITMLDAVRAQGVPVDGIGLQAHVRMGWPSVGELRTAIDKIIAAGYAVKISELDMTVYTDYDAMGAFTGADEVPFTAELEAEQAAAYGGLFELFREKSDHITSVTFWGVSDDATWLDHEPVSGRDNYPLLWNDAHEPKLAYDAVKNF